MTRFSLFFAIAYSLLPAAFAGSKVAVATFYNHDMNGTIRFSQANSISPVTINVNLNGLNNIAGSYHVHSFPVAGHNAIDDGCGADVTGGHYNPLGVAGGAGVAGTYSCSGASDTGCEAGDLSGKHGSLSSLDELIASYTDSATGLTLYGKNSIVGRSIVIHKLIGGDRWVCATIKEVGETITVVATFEGVLEGTITLTQSTNSVQDDTTIFVQLTSAAATSNHKWHIHQTPVTTDCASTGSHYNPTLVTGGEGVAGTYNCDMATFVGCEIGDLYGKHGGLSFDGSKMLFTESELPLHGENSVAGRSIVIHDAELGAPRYACASLGKTAMASFDYTRASGRLLGTIKFFQAHATAPVHTTVDLAGLNSEAGNYHVHELPVERVAETSTVQSCSAERTAGHYNPLGVVGGAGETGTYSCTGVTDTGCEAGDLSGKYGAFTGADDLTATYEDADTGLTLFGENSIVGRSIVIHDTNGDRWVCATIFPELEMITQYAFFTSPAFGFIGLSQPRVDPVAETIVAVSLSNEDDSSTASHSWHIHETPVSGDCSTTGGHYNPEGVNGGAGFTVEFAYLCATLGIDFCEVGDQSNKIEALALPGVKLYTDPKLPLSGLYSVADRSIVVHESAGSARFDCATLETYGTSAAVSRHLGVAAVAVALFAISITM